MLRLRRGDLLSNRHRRPVKLGAQRDARQLVDRGRKINMRGGVVDALILGHAGPADVEGDVDVLFVARGLAGHQPVVADVEAVVRRVHDVRVVQEVELLELVEDVVDQVVHGLQGLEAFSVEEVEILDDRVVVPVEGLEIAGGARLCGKKKKKKTLARDI